jgi:hypothetical protein
MNSHIEDIRKEIMLQMGGKDFYRAYVKLNTLTIDKEEDYDDITDIREYFKMKRDNNKK